MMPVRLGVIGCGVIGSKHIAAATNADHIDLVAVADLRRDLAQRLAGEYGVPKVYAEADALIADPEIEAVAFLVPN